MSERVWARVGQIGTALAGIAAVVALIVSPNTPSSRLVAEIRPMAFRLPLTAGEIAELTQTDKPASAAIAELMKVSRATGLVKMDLYNNGDFPISAIHINVADAVLYAKGTEGVDDSSILPSDQSGTTLDNLTQGSSTTIYVWTETQAETYRHWANLDDKFKITFSQGVARKYIYVEGNQFFAWVERNVGLLILLLVGLSTIASSIMMFGAGFRTTQLERAVARLRKSSEGPASTPDLKC